MTTVKKGIKVKDLSGAVICNKALQTPVLYLGLTPSPLSFSTVFQDADICGRCSVSTG